MLEEYALILVCIRTTEIQPQHPSPREVAPLLYCFLNICLIPVCF